MSKRPKRRKSVDNPYNISYCEITDKYRVTFLDGKGNFQNVEINKEIFNAFDNFELEDLSMLNEYDKSY